MQNARNKERFRFNQRGSSRLPALTVPSALLFNIDRGSDVFTAPEFAKRTSCCQFSVSTTSDSGASPCSLPEK